MEYIGSSKTKYTLENTPFKKGGEGSVYNIVGKADCVAKIYHGNVITAELETKIKYITNNPPSKTILDQIAWPLDYLRNANGQFVGFVMPKLKIDAELGELYKYPSKKIKLTNEQKLVVAINICRVISEVHKAGYVFGDFNPCNIGVNLTTGNVAFLDTDSYHIYDKDTKHTYRCSVCLPGYVAPELIQRCKGADFKSAPLPTFTQETDRFALAIHIFKLLFNGYTPFNGIPENITSSQASPGQGNEAIEKDNYCFKPGNKPMSSSVPPMDSFPPEICDLFSRAFIVGRYNATLRPTAEEWDKALCDYRNNLVICQANPLHSYYNVLQACPYCQAEINYNMNLSGKKVYGNSVSQLNFSNPVAAPVSSTPTPRTTSSITGSGSKASATLTGAINKRNQKSKVGFRKKFKIGIIASLCLLIIGSGVAGGIYYKNGVEAVNKTIELIDYLPDQISDYAYYETLMNDAYTAYDDLSEWQQKKVTNRDKLLAIIPAFNEYKVETLRATAENVTVETVGSTTALADTVKLYRELNDEQKSLLSGDEVVKFDNYVKVNQVVNELNAINDDLVNKYDTLKDTNRVYYSIGDTYKPLVYNYSLVETFDAQLAFLNKFTFTETGGGYIIKAAEGVLFEGVLELPAKYKGEDIVKIEGNGFRNQSKITALIVPDTVKTIESMAFNGCNNIEEVTVPFTGFRMDARNSFGAIFSGTTSVPQSLKTVTITLQNRAEDSTFSGCNFIEQIYYKAELEYIGANAFNGCESLKFFNSDEEGTLNLAGEIDSIGESAFKDCTSIKKIIFPKGSLAIENNAFSGCKNIETLTLTNQITKIGSCAFQDLKKITEIDVYDSTQSIGMGTFEGCNNLERVTLPFTGKDINSTEKFSYIFGNSAVPQSLKTVTITLKDRVENLVFSGCNYIEKVYYNAELEYIGSNCFNGCEALLSFNSDETGTLNLAGTMDAVGDSAFKDCQSIKKIIFSNEILTINNNAFSGCKNIETLTLTNRITKIGEYAFQGLNKITEVIVYNSTEVIGLGAFKGCNRLVEISLPFTGNKKDSVSKEQVFGYIFGYTYTYSAYSTNAATTGTYNPDYGFRNTIYNNSGYYDDSATWQYTYKNYDVGLGSNGYTSFYYYIPSSLRKVTITNQTEVKTAAFNGCTMLTNITYTQGIESQGDCAFQNCTAVVNG